MSQSPFFVMDDYSFSDSDTEPEAPTTTTTDADAASQHRKKPKPPPPELTPQQLEWLSGALASLALSNGDGNDSHSHSASTPSGGPIGIDSPHDNERWPQVRTAFNAEFGTGYSVARLKGGWIWGKEIGDEDMEREGETEIGDEEDKKVDEGENGDGEGEWRDGVWKEQRCREGRWVWEDVEEEMGDGEKREV